MKYNIVRIDGFNIEVIASHKTKKEAVKKLKDIRSEYHMLVHRISSFFNEYRVLPFFRIKLYGNRTVIYKIERIK